ncbi:hypothetical protein Tco_0057851 [Tanacetum coccineum]
MPPTTPEPTTSSTRGRDNIQHAEDVTEVGSNQRNSCQVLGNVRKRVRGPTFMPKVWTKTEEDRISVQFNEYGQPVDETTSTLTHFIGSLARSGKYCKIHKPWNKVKNAQKQILLDTVILGREPTRKELFRACFSKDGITQNVEAANAIEQMDELTSQLSEHELAYLKIYILNRFAHRRDKLQLKSTAEQLSSELAEYKARESQRQESDDNDSYGTNVPHTSPQGLIVAHEPQPLRIILNSEIIAKGWIRSLDPDEVVGSEEINVRARNCEWVKISMRKVHILLEMEDNDERKSFIDYLCIDFNYVEEQRNNLVLKHKDLVQELNTCKEQFSGQTDLVFVKSSADETNVSFFNVERPWLSEAEGFNLPNHDTGRILPSESQVKVTDSLVNVTDSSVTNYDSVDESSVCSTHLPLLEKLVGIELVSGPKTIKTILKSNSTFKAKTLKGNLRVGNLTREMTKDLGAASAHECQFIDFLSKKEPKRVFEALKHPGWVDVMQEELN